MVSKPAITSPRQGLPASSWVRMAFLAEELARPYKLTPSVLCRFLIFRQITHIQRFLRGRLKIAHGLKQHARSWFAAVIHGAELLYRGFGVGVADVEPALGDTCDASHGL